MQPPAPSLPHLFQQLGLDDTPVQIDRFIETHGHLPASVLLADAPFWKPAQASFLREQLLADAEWSDVVDALNVRLHG